MLKWIKKIFISSPDEIISPEIEEERVHPLIERINIIKTYPDYKELLLSEIVQIYDLNLHYSRYSILIGTEPIGREGTGVIKSVGEYFKNRLGNSHLILTQLERIISSGRMSEEKERDITEIIEMFEFYLLGD